MSIARIVVLLSGHGTNLQALIDACASGAISNAQIVQVISNRRDAYGLKRSEAAGIPSGYHNLLKFKKDHPDLEPAKQREAYDEALADIVLKSEPQLVVCAGWMHILAATFLEPLACASVPIINLHPALPGEFNGAGAIERAYAAFKLGKTQRTGLMIHYVIAEVDMGPPILTQEVEILPEDSLSDLETRIHSKEHEAIVRATDLILGELRETKKHIKII